MSRILLLLLFIGCSTVEDEPLVVFEDSIIETRLLNNEETQWYKEQVECFFELGVLSLQEAIDLILSSGLTVVNLIEKGGCFSAIRNKGFDACYLDGEIYYSGERLGFDHEVGHDIENKIFGLPEFFESHSNRDFWELGENGLHQSRCQ